MFPLVSHVTSALLKFYTSFSELIRSLPSVADHEYHCCGIDTDFVIFISETVSESGVSHEVHQVKKDHPQYAAVVAFNQKSFQKSHVFDEIELGKCMIRYEKIISYNQLPREWYPMLPLPLDAIVPVTPATVLGDEVVQCHVLDISFASHFAEKGFLHLEEPWMRDYYGHVPEKMNGAAPSQKRTGYCWMCGFSCLLPGPNYFVLFQTADQYLCQRCNAFVTCLGDVNLFPLPRACLRTESAKRLWIPPYLWTRKFSSINSSSPSLWDLLKVNEVQRYIPDSLKAIIKQCCCEAELRLAVNMLPDSMLPNLRLHYDEHWIENVLPVCGWQMKEQFLEDFPRQIRPSGCCESCGFFQKPCHPHRVASNGWLLCEVCTNISRIFQFPGTERCVLPFELCSIEDRKKAAEKGVFPFQWLRTYSSPNNSMLCTLKKNRCRAQSQLKRCIDECNGRKMDDLRNLVFSRVESEGRDLEGFQFQLDVEYVQQQE